MGKLWTKKYRKISILDILAIFLQLVLSFTAFGSSADIRQRHYTTPERRAQLRNGSAAESMLPSSSLFSMYELHLPLAVVCTLPGICWPVFCAS